jgi:hypothetical protein
MVDWERQERRGHQQQSRGEDDLAHMFACFECGNVWSMMQWIFPASTIGQTASSMPES